LLSAKALAKSYAGMTRVMKFLVELGVKSFGAQLQKLRKNK
jgi:hypothetical protein